MNGNVEADTSQRLIKVDRLSSKDMGAYQAKPSLKKET